MTAQADTESRIYYCLVCGPCLQETIETDDGEEIYTLHRDVYHPYDMSFDEEDHPQ